MSISEVQIGESNQEIAAEVYSRLPVSDVMAFIGEKVARTIPSPPVGTDPDDMAQEVVVKLIRRDGDLSSISSAIQEGRKGEAINRVKNYAIDSAREAAEPGNYVFLKALHELDTSGSITESKSALGQAARRRAFRYYKGEGSSHEGSEQHDIFGGPAPTLTDEYGHPSGPVEYRELFELLMEEVPNLQKEATAQRNKKLVGMYLDGYQLPEIAVVLDIPLGTAKSIWREFRLSAQAILLAKGYVSEAGL